MTDYVEFNKLNRQIIDDFRENGGVVVGVPRFSKAPLILINHRGAKTGKEYTTPLVYTRDGDNYVIIASKGGEPKDPHWLANLVAHPDITIEVGTEKFPVRARVAEGDERDRLYQAQAEVMPNFADYATRTTRVIPVVVLERA